MEAKPVLHYFKYYGRAEPIRLALTYFGIDFDEVVLKHESSDGAEGAEEWKEKKKNYEFGAVPVLEIDGKKLAQSKAILRYICMREGHYPTDPYEIYRVESLVDFYLDMMDAMEVAFEKSGWSIQELLKFVDEMLPKRMPQLTKRLEANSNQDYLVGDKISMADILFLDFRYSSFGGITEELKQANIERFKPYPKLVAYFEKRRPDFAKRLDNRPLYEQ